MSRIDPATQHLCCQIREQMGCLRTTLKELRGKLDSEDLDAANVFLLQFMAVINRTEFVPPASQVLHVSSPQPDRKRLAANDFLQEGLKP